MKLILAGSKVMWTLFVVGVSALVTYTTYDRSQGVVRHDAAAGAVAAADSLRLALPILGLVATSSWVARRLENNGDRDLYLAGTRASRFLWRASTRIAVLVVLIGLLASAVAVLASATIWAHPATALPGGLVPDFVHSDPTPRSAWLVAVVGLWAALGALLGYLVRRAAVATAIALTVLFSSVLLERAAVVHPLMLTVHSLTPLGASNALVLGESVPDLPRSAVPTGLALVTFGAWALLACALLASRTWTSYLSVAENSLRAVQTRTLLCGFVGAALFLAGFVIPTQLASRIPWQYKATWRESVAAHTTPADTVAGVLTALGGGDRAAMRGRILPGNRDALRQLAVAMENSGSDVEVQNVLGEADPGSVVVNVGATEVSEGGEVLPPDQFGFCLVRHSQRWVVSHISPQGVTCV